MIVVQVQHVLLYMLMSAVCHVVSVHDVVQPADPNKRHPDLLKTWVHKSSSRIWRGSYAGGDWQVNHNTRGKTNLTSRQAYLSFCLSMFDTLPLACIRSVT